MGFGNLQSRDGLLLLNNFLADKSYIEGFVFNFDLIYVKFLLFYRYHPTQGDLVVFEAVKTTPSTDLQNVLRWYKHIASFSDIERQK